MNKIVFFLLSLSLLLGVIYADESEYPIDSTEILQNTQETNFEDIPITSDFFSDFDDYLSIVSNDPALVNDNIVSSVRSVVSPVTPSNTQGLKSAIVAVLGNYDPVIVEYQYQSSNGYYSYLREIQPDYVWLCSCAILLVVIFCLFRLLGGIFNGKR